VRDRVLLVTLALACQPRAKPVAAVSGNSTSASEQLADSAAPKLADFDGLTLGVAFHLDRDQQAIESFSLQLSGPPDRKGRCPSCLDVDIEVDGQPFRPPRAAEPSRACTREQTPDTGVHPVYPRCSSGHDAFVRLLDPALLEPRRSEARTTFRVSDGTTTFAATFQNLLAVRDLSLTKPQDGVLHLAESVVELSLVPNTDRLDAVSGPAPAAEVHLPDGAALSLVSDGDPEHLRFESNGEWLLMNRLPTGPATLVVSNVRHEVGQVACSGPRFCTAVVPYPLDEKRFAITLAH